MKQTACVCIVATFTASVDRHFGRKVRNVEVYPVGSAERFKEYGIFVALKNGFLSLPQCLRQGGQVIAYGEDYITVSIIDHFEVSP